MGALIFVRRDAVRGLTTAAVVWLTAAVGMAAGANHRHQVTVRLLVQGRRPVADLAASLTELVGVRAVSSMRETID